MWKENESYFVRPYGRIKWGEKEGQVFGPFTQEEFDNMYFVPSE